MSDINSAISAAVGEARTESGASEPEPVVAPASEPAATEPAATEPAATEPAATTAKIEPDEEEFYNPTAEELAVIENSPELKKAYRALRKGFTTKTTELAAQRKELGERAELAAWIQMNPEKAARRLAELSGLSISEARAEVKEAKEAAGAVTDELTAMWNKGVGDEATPILRPVIEATAQAVIERVLGPLRAQTEELVTAAQRRGIASTISEFGAGVVQRGEEWSPEIQAEMAKLTTTTTAADGATIEDYLSTLYDTTMMRRSRSQTSRANLARLRRIRDDAEPVVPARPTAKTEERITADMNDRDAVALAVRQATKQLQR